MIRVRDCGHRSCLLRIFQSRPYHSHCGMDQSSVSPNPPSTSEGVEVIGTALYVYGDDRRRENDRGPHENDHDRHGNGRGGCSHWPHSPRR